MEKLSFDLEKFDLKLATNQIGRNFVYAEEVESTNTLLLSGKRIFRKNGTVLFTEFQSAGRGRMGRRWFSARGVNLIFSILINDQTYLRQKINLLNLVTALAIGNSIENLFQIPVELKWPNDVLLNTKKVAGVLLESVSSGSVIEKLVIGVGVNVNQTSFQGDFNIEPISIKNVLNHNIDRERFLAEILNNFEKHLKTVRQKPAKILNDWRAKCRMIGERITVSEGKSSKSGIFEDIDKNGFLILKTDSGREIIRFGDVSLR